MEKTMKLIQDFFKDNEKLSRETKRSYQISLNQFFNFSSIEFTDVKPSNIRKWMSDLETKGLQRRSVCLKLAAVRSFYRYAQEEDYILKNPVVKSLTPKIEESIPFYLKRADLAKLRELTKGNLRERAFVETLYTTGLRISELLNVRLEDVKWDEMSIWVRKGKGNKERHVLMTSECIVRLEEYLKHRKVESPYLFANSQGKPLSRSWAEGKFKEYSQALKLDHKVTPHTMRHTFGAHLAERNMPQSHIQELLGHYNINSTGIYTKLNEEAQKRKYDSLRI